MLPRSAVNAASFTTHFFPGTIAGIDTARAPVLVKFTTLTDVSKTVEFADTVVTHAVGFDIVFDTVSTTALVALDVVHAIRRFDGLALH